jgi:hypothetical protein
MRKKIEALMTILLISWVCASMALCLVFLSVAARQVPRMDEQLVANGQPALRQETAVVLKMPPRYHSVRKKGIPESKDIVNYSGIMAFTDPA